MLTYAQVSQSPTILRSLTGLTPRGFDQLLRAFEQGYEQDLAEAEAQRGALRHCAIGGGRKARLATMADKLLFILFYFRVYPTQVTLGFFFGLSQPQANA